MTEPSEILREEHEAIEHLLHVLGAMASDAERGSSIDPRDAEAALEVVTGFADRCHHAKEERVLFPALLKASPGESEALLRKLEGEHDAGRRLVAAMRASLPGLGTADAAARKRFADSALAYVGLLQDHIAVETAALLPLTDRALSGPQRSALAAEFERVEREETGTGVHERYAGTIVRLADKYVHRKA